MEKVIFRENAGIKMGSENFLSFSDSENFLFLSFSKETVKAIKRIIKHSDVILSHDLCYIVSWVGYLHCQTLVFL